MVKNMKMHKQIFILFVLLRKWVKIRKQCIIDIGAFIGLHLKPLFRMIRHMLVLCPAYAI